MDNVTFVPMVAVLPEATLTELLPALAVTVTAVLLVSVYPELLNVIVVAVSAVLHRMP